MHDMIVCRAQAREHAPDRLDRRAQATQISTEAMHIAALAAEIMLHVDDDQYGVVRPEVAVERERMGISGHPISHVAPSQPTAQSFGPTILIGPTILVSS